MTRIRTGLLTVLLIAAVATACGGDDDIDLGTDPDVQAILEGYEQLGVSDAEVDQMARDIGTALDMIDSPEDQRDYLKQLRDQVEDSVEAVEAAE